MAASSLASSALRTQLGAAPRVAARRGGASSRRSGSSARVRAHGPGGGQHLTARDVADAAKAPVSPAGFAAAVMDGPDVSSDADAGRKHVYVETYGCQMNVNDSEVMLSVLERAGYDQTEDMHDADVILVNTCAIREKAEAKIWQRLAYFKSLRRRKKKSEKPVVGVLGCMAERLKTKLLEADQLADLVAGPDAYRDLPNLITAVAGTGEKAMNVQLSVEETYADIVPVRREGAHAAFVTIMRGCDNACSFCIVPYTRGRERSRDPASIEYEVRLLSEQGVKEVTLLGQNVNSYAYSDEDGGAETDFLAALTSGTDDGRAREEEELDAEDVEGSIVHPSVVAAGGTPFNGYADGFTSRYRPERRREGAVQFAALLDRVAAIDPEMRVRFTSPHPKDFPDEVLDVIARRPNVCNCLHMPAQSGSTTMLDRMARGYTREAYSALIEKTRRKIPGCAITTDIIAGFCHETEEEHRDTVSLMTEVGYEQAFMFAYSEREGTSAARNLKDDVPEATKQRRLREIIDAFRAAAEAKQEAEIGRVHLCTVEGPSKKNPEELTGKTDSSKWAVFSADPVGIYAGDVEEASVGAEKAKSPPRTGEYVAVKITGCSTGTLFGECLGRTTLTAFHEMHGNAWTEVGETKEGEGRGEASVGGEEAPAAAKAR